MLLSIINISHKFTMSSTYPPRSGRNGGFFLGNIRPVQVTADTPNHRKCKLSFIMEEVLYSRQTDLSVSSLTKLEEISDTPQWRYVHHLTVKGSDEHNRTLGEGLAGKCLPERQVALIWPVVILLRFPNCTSFEVDAVSEYNCPVLSSTLFHTEAISLILAVISLTGHPVKSLTVDFRDACLDPTELAAVHVNNARFVLGGHIFEN